jgi:hypothetical protein
VRRAPVALQEGRRQQAAAVQLLESVAVQPLEVQQQVVAQPLEAQQAAARGAGEGTPDPIRCATSI